MSTASEQALEKIIQEKGLTKGPRVTPEQIDAMIAKQEMIELEGIGAIVLLTLHNGLKVLGANLGSISPENFDPEIAKNLAHRDARDKVWPIAGAILAEDIYRGNMPLTEAQRALPAHVQRVLVEMYQTGARLAGLTDFLSAFDAGELDPELVAQLAPEEIADLRTQHGLMKEYVQVLQRRLDRAGA